MPRNMRNTGRAATPARRRVANTSARRTVSGRPLPRRAAQRPPVNAHRERMEARRRAERIAKARARRAAEQENENLEEVLEDEAEEREARKRRARAARRRAAARKRAQAQAKRTPQRRANAQRPGARIAAPVRRQRISKIDELNRKLDRIARLLEKRAVNDRDPLEGLTGDLDRGLGDDPRPFELDIPELNEQPVTEEEARAEEVGSDSGKVDTKPVSSKVRPIRMARSANRGSGNISLF